MFLPCSNTKYVTIYSCLKCCEMFLKQSCGGLTFSARSCQTSIIVLSGPSMSVNNEQHFLHYSNKIGLSQDITTVFYTTFEKKIM